MHSFGGRPLKVPFDFKQKTLGAFTIFAHFESNILLAVGVPLTARGPCALYLHKLLRATASARTLNLQYIYAIKLEILANQPDC